MKDRFISRVRNQMNYLRLPWLVLAALATTSCNLPEPHMVPIGEIRPDLAEVVEHDFPVPAGARFSLNTVCKTCVPPHANFRVEVNARKPRLERAWRSALIDAGYEIISATEHQEFTFDETYFGHPTHDIDSERSNIMVVDSGDQSWAPVSYYETWKDPYPIDHDPRSFSVLPGVLPDDAPLPIGTKVFSSETCYPDVCEAPYTKLLLDTRLAKDALAETFQSAFQNAGYTTEWRSDRDKIDRRSLHFGHPDRRIDKDRSYVRIGYQVEIMLQLEPGAIFADVAADAG